MNPYETLGIDKTASEEEVRNKFKEILEEYTKNPDDATKQRIQTIRIAYDLIINEELYKEIRSLIEKKNFLDAETKLNIINNSNSAEWNYLEGFVLVQKGWYDSGLKFLRKSVELDSNNIEYLDSLNKLQGRVIDYVNKYSKKNMNSNSNNMNACGGNNNNNGGMC